MLPDGGREGAEGAPCPYAPSGAVDRQVSRGLTFRPSVGRSLSVAYLAGVISVQQWRHMCIALGLSQKQLIDDFSSQARHSFAFISHDYEERLAAHALVNRFLALTQ